MIISLDCETTGKDLFHGSQPFMICTLDEDGTSHTWEWPVDPFEREVHLIPSQILALEDYLTDKTVVFHNSIFDLRCLSMLGITISWEQVHDTMLLSHVCNSQGAGTRASSDQGGMHGLKQLASYYLDISDNDEKELRKITASARGVGKQLGWKLGTKLVPNAKGHHEAELESDYWMPRTVFDHDSGPADFLYEWKDICETYCKKDCFRTLGLFFFLQEILKDKGLEKHYERERQLLPVTYNMGTVGLNTSDTLLSGLNNEFISKSTTAKQEAENILKTYSGLSKLCINSPKQLGAVLSKCGLSLTRKTDKGNISTDASALINLAQQCEKVPSLGNYRSHKIGEALRLIAGYDPEEGDTDADGDKLEQAIPGYRTFITGCRYLRGYSYLRDSNGRLHPSFNQVGTAWTRYASYNPNGQNVSVKAALPLRRVFGPPEGYIWFAIDYSQLELRIFAYASNDQKLISAFDSGFDFHTTTACTMYGVAPEKVTKEQRRFAKNVNFGIIFGAGPAKIDYQTGQPGTYAQYMARFPDASRFMRRTINQVNATGIITTLSGYQLYVPQDEPHKGVNAIVQGTAGDIVKYAMIDIHERGLVDWEPNGSSIITNNHDELVFQIPKSYPYKAIGRRLIQVMEQAGSNLGVVTPCDAKLIHTNWMEGESFK